jgi:hypothetical protein
MKTSQSTRGGRRPAKNLSPRKTEDVKGGRDAATGMATGKRQHGTLIITKELGPSS